MKLTCTKQEFKNWLLAKKPNSIVGYPQDGRSCPVAKYFYQLNELDGKKYYISVIWNVRVKHSNGSLTTFQSSPLKAWMRNFIGKIDSIDDTEISAKKALEVLSKC